MKALLSSTKRSRIQFVSGSSLLLQLIRLISTIEVTYLIENLLNGRYYQRRCRQGENEDGQGGNKIKTLIAATRRITMM